MLGRRTVEDLLELCLAHPEAGRAEVERLLAESPERADEVRPLLELVAGLRAGRPPLEPQADFARQLGLRLRRRTPAQPRPVAAPRRLWPALGLRPVAALLTALTVALVALGSIGIVQASAAALPGDELYAVKRGVEEIRLALAWTPAADARLLSDLADERLDEIEALAGADRMDDLETALDAYVLAVGRLARAVEVPAAGGTDEVLDKLTHHIAVLEDVQARVPPPAQESIERVIERSIDAETTGRPQAPTQTPSPDEDVCPLDLPDCPPGAAGADPIDRMAAQIAKIYSVTPEQVRAVLEGECQGDWKCVRSHFRVEKPKNPHSP